MRVVIADDEVLLRQGVARLLADGGIEIVGLAGDATELLTVASRVRPDAVVVDIRMPPTYSDEGLAAARTLRTELPGVGVLVLSHHLDSRYAVELLETFPGGAGYLLKERVSDIAVVTDALARLDRGECVIDPTIVARLLRRPPSPELGSLSSRELEVLGLIAEGRSNAAIGAALFLSPKTVEAHVGHVFAKLGLTESPDDHRRVLATLAYLRSDR